jgi:hypothetical protein
MSRGINCQVVRESCGRNYAGYLGEHGLDNCITLLRYPILYTGHRNWIMREMYI